ncbi:protein melted-like [Centruroides sculpturatus]|uniref:protein melted-like n=1 Tax=Centruroides sculpturatus TaxID=218467 RepID=UPI000C6DFE15|nr:protein melted-like [Centruroides sculpturatus]
MHDLFAQVLNNRDLSRAGDLFSIDDKSVVNDLSEVLSKIQDIASASDFIHNDNNQSVVEICITRATSAIRETGTIEYHAKAMVTLLESCLNHDLRPSAKDEDPPHAKIASDIVSCIFLNHSKKNVMRLALPVAVKFLHRGNKELSRNLSSYLSLAAINNAELLAPHIQPIIDSIISGNYSLARVLPQIYAVNKEPIHDHVMALVSLLPQCENSEKLSLLNLFGLIAKHKPSLLESNLPQLSECLTISSTATSVLQIFLDMAAVRPQSFTEHIQKIKMAAEQQPGTITLVARMLGIIGKLNKKYSNYVNIVLIMTGFFRSQHLINQTSGGVTIVKVGGSKQELTTITQTTTTVSTVQSLSPSSGFISPILMKPNIQHGGMRGSRSNLIISRQNPVLPPEARSMTQLSSLQAVNCSMGRLPSMNTSIHISSGSMPTLQEEAPTSVTVSINSAIPHSNPGQDGPSLHPSQSTSPTTSASQSAITPVTSHNQQAVTVSLNSTTVPSSAVTSISHSPKMRNNTSVTLITHTGSANPQRISVFEPYPMRDAVQHFCEKHLDKIKAYMQKIFVKIPLPVKCTIEGKHDFKLLARASSALSTREASVGSLKNCWDTLKADNKTFLTLVTSAFPSAKDNDMLINELRNYRFFDVFEYNGPKNIWGCFLCNHPERALGFLQTNEPVIEGQLKEKKGRWKLFRRWRTRYFTLSGAHLSYRGSKGDKEVSPIEVSQIRSVRAISSRRNIPKAFEIFTDDRTFVLKAKDSKNTEQWVQCISIAMAHSHAKDTTH